MINVGTIDIEKQSEFAHKMLEYRRNLPKFYLWGVSFD